ncbi:glycosyltransferase family 4 protein [Tessaracoccus sp. HDW20]|uniref:glycosyltransferase n=1 Tax=Tessaracoccus coleopterorum TaxID=2714950 RepID=UPI0018D4A894|nr:glycosyltransferase family 4 protein [Tessaracoccus coleopterorum]
MRAYAAAGLHGVVIDYSPSTPTRHGGRTSPTLPCCRSAPPNCPPRSTPPPRVGRRSSRIPHPAGHRRTPGAGAGAPVGDLVPRLRGARLPQAARQHHDRGVDGDPAHQGRPEPRPVRRRPAAVRRSRHHEGVHVGDAAALLRVRRRHRGRERADHPQLHRRRPVRRAGPRPEEARRILLLRSFATHNYGGDIAIRALDLCSRREGFAELQITIRGYGVRFREAVRDIRRLDNVTVSEGFSRPARMAALYDAHGVALVPTRYDTQGVMLGEAMASGAVTITNPVAAIPEFTDSRSSLLPAGTTRAPSLTPSGTWSGTRT